MTDHTPTDPAVHSRAGHAPAPVDLDTLTFADPTTTVPPTDLPPHPTPDDVKVARSYRLPVELDHWIQQTAHAKGTKPSTLVRDLLELGRTAYQDADRPVCLADVLRALASVRTTDVA